MLMALSFRINKGTGVTTVGDGGRKRREDTRGIPRAPIHDHVLTDGEDEKVKTSLDFMVTLARRVACA